MLAHVSPLLIFSSLGLFSVSFISGLIAVDGARWLASGNFSESGFSPDFQGRKAVLTSIRTLQFRIWIVQFCIWTVLFRI
jgi:hypothetical protein